MNEPQYTLHIVNHKPLPYRFIDAAILAGQVYNEPFTVNLVSPEMVVCYWQPGMSKVTWNETYQKWYEAQQVGLQGVMG